jgi:hypothetical protein
MKVPRFISYGFLAALCIAGGWVLFAHISHRPPALPFTQQVYVWQMHWDDAVRQAIDRSQPQVDGFMLLIGELGYDGKDFTFLPASPNPQGISKPVTVVLRVRNDFSKAITQHHTSAAVEYILGRLGPYLSAKHDSSYRRAVQIDFDCPTSAVSAYAEFLKALRTALPQTQLSVTALPDWLNSPAFPDLLAHVDYFVLQVHSRGTPTTVDAPYSLCDPKKARRAVERVSRMGVPFYVALPTYSYRLLFDQQGRIRSVIAEQTTETPAPGMTTRDVSADPAALADLARGWHANPPDNCLGLAWFRLPVEGDRHNLPWRAFASLLKGDAPNTSFTAEMRQPESGLYELWLSNTGDYAPSEPVSCEVRWKNDAVLAYDIIGGYKGRGAFGQNFVQVQGPAPEANVPPKVVGWFRVRPEHNEEKEVVQCSAVHVVSPPGT